MIKLQESSPEKLIITVSDPAFEMIWLACAVLFSAWSVYLYTQYPDVMSMGKFQGSVAAALICALGYAVVFERASFVFDKPSQTVQWSRTRITGKRSGTLRFGEIKQVTALRMTGDDKYYPYRRLSIHTAEREIPITAAFVPDSRGERVEMADKIRKFVGLV